MQGQMQVGMQMPIMLCNELETAHQENTIFGFLQLFASYQILLRRDKIK